MISLKKMRDDLDYWIHIGIGDDIVYAPRAREEYQHLVAPLREQKVPVENIAPIVLEALDREMKLPLWKQRTLWIALKVSIQRFFRKFLMGL